MGSQDRRRYPRARVDVAARLVVDAPPSSQRVQIVDLSEGGALISGAATVERGDRVSVRIEGDGREGSAAWGSVVRADGASRHGIEFIDVDTDIREFIRGLFSVARELHTQLSDEPTEE